MKCESGHYSVSVIEVGGEGFAKRKVVLQSPPVSFHYWRKRLSQVHMSEGYLQLVLLQHSYAPLGGH